MKRHSSISALPTASDRPIPQYGKDRTCAVCDTKLSRYNEGDHCGVHRGWGEGPRRGGRP